MLTLVGALLLFILAVLALRQGMWWAPIFMFIGGVICLLRTFISLADIGTWIFVIIVMFIGWRLGRSWNDMGSNSGHNHNGYIGYWMNNQD